MKELYLVLGMTIVTFAVRYPVLALLGKFELPPQVLRALKFVPAAVLTAIIVPAVLSTGNGLQLGVDNPAIFGALAAVLVSWRTKNLALTILAGMGVFYFWRYLF